MRVLNAVALQSPQIIRVAQFGANGLEQLPVTLGSFMTDLLLQVALQIGRDMIVVKQRVVYIKEKNGVVERHVDHWIWWRLRSATIITCISRACRTTCRNRFFPIGAGH